MNDKIISGRALNALAFLVAEVRRRAGGTDWQEPGILDALARATDHARCSDAGTLVLAAIRAASDGKNRTPAVIALDGKHWDERLKEPERKITMGTDATFCDQCRYPDGRRVLVVPGEVHEHWGPRTPGRAAEAKRVAAEARGQYERAMGERVEAMLRGAAEQAARGECGHTDEPAEITGCPVCLQRDMSERVEART